MKRKIIAIAICAILVNCLSNICIFATNRENITNTLHQSARDKELFEELKTLISEDYNIDRDRILLESLFYEDLGFDTLDLLELCAKCEDIYDIEIYLDEFENIETVKHLHDLIEYRLEN